MRAYQYNTNGMYLGETEADESPLEPGVYHLPARTTLVAPPTTVPAGKWPRWNGVTWELVNQFVPANDNDPVAKLKAFLEQHPDVADMLSLSNKGGANV